MTSPEDPVGRLRRIERRSFLGDQLACAFSSLLLALSQLLRWLFSMRTKESAHSSSPNVFGWVRRVRARELPLQRGKSAGTVRDRVVLSAKHVLFHLASPMVQRFQGLDWLCFGLYYSVLSRKFSTRFSNCLDVFESPSSRFPGPLS